MQRARLLSLGLAAPTASRPVSSGITSHTPQSTPFLNPRIRWSSWLRSTPSPQCSSKRAIMDKVKGGKGTGARPKPPQQPPKAAQNEPIFEDAVAPALPELTAEQRAAAKRAFPDLYQFLDQLDDTHRTVDTGEAPNESLRQKAEEDSARKSRVFARYLDDDDESEEQWDDSVQFDKSLSETQEPQLGMSDEEREAMSYLNDVIHRVRSKDEGEEDPLVLLFRKLDQENEAMRIQHEHVENMPEFIGYNEEFEEEEARIRKAWEEDPRSVTPEHVQELYRALEDKRQELWEKYTTRAAQRYVAENYEQLVLQSLGGNDDEDGGGESQRTPELRPPLGQLIDPRLRVK